jgi:ubiquinone/menaquinone biosynthesis C-methylase UbiE
MKSKLFDPKKFEKLNNPKRLEMLPPIFIKEKAGLNEVKIILDIGAGTGFFSKEFAKLYPGSLVYACDTSEFMINYINENLRAHYSELRPLLMKDYHIPLEDGIADLIIMINLHHEIDDHETMLRECYRLLRPQGKIVISDWKKEDSGFGPSMHIRFEVSEVEGQLRSAAFEEINSNLELKNNFIIVAEKPKVKK